MRVRVVVTLGRGKLLSVALLVAGILLWVALLVVDIWLLVVPFDRPQGRELGRHSADLFRWSQAFCSSSWLLVVSGLLGRHSWLQVFRLVLVALLFMQLVVSVAILGRRYCAFGHALGRGITLGRGSWSRSGSLAFGSELIVAALGRGHFSLDRGYRSRSWSRILLLVAAHGCAGRESGLLGRHCWSPIFCLPPDATETSRRRTESACHGVHSQSLLA